MIELLLTRNLSNFLKAKIIRVRFGKRKRDVNKVLSQTGYVNHPLFCRDSDHRFCRMNGHFPDRLERINKMSEQLNCVFTFSMQEIVKHFITARMRLVVFYKLLLAVRARPHSFKYRVNYAFPKYDRAIFQYF